MQSTINIHIVYAFFKNFQLIVSEVKWVGCLISH